ncbi:MAG: bifunctional 23S rRNA (guanine(2069)-N(7))-methyltransferase RlmK/23S rRNA (guanine(2445)-N(2))-methyltransferase RlmL [Planctomycetota bacterium]|nr:bifunctional 23S rRNA (guanine(2069)-N(7))-methyltransferase RlmK/23S rRNA (guanine(2445)-N(2))-methyltransferase RlmL [Planctomycetota bacterium]
MSTPTSSSLQLVATTAYGLEAVVARELQILGYSAKIGAPGWVHYAGNLFDLSRTNLWLRSADRILLQLCEFPCPDVEALFDAVRAVPWEEWLSGNSRIFVSARSHKSQLSNIAACQTTVTQAIAERLRKANSLATLSPTGAEYGVRLVLRDGQATLALDSSGPGLQHRGYRDPDRPAHVKETLAAAMIMLSFWQPDRPFMDPFCQSGTVLIEASWIAQNIAPGSLRQFAAENWERMDPQLWAEARAEALQRRAKGHSLEILGFDNSSRSLQEVRTSAKIAGVSASLNLQQLPFSQVHSSHEFGCVITRIPESTATPDQAHERSAHRLPAVAGRSALSSHDSVVNQIPQVLRRFPTWSHFLLSTHPEFERLVEKPADRRRKLYNDATCCTYYQYHGPPPQRRTTRLLETDHVADQTSVPLPAASDRSASNATIPMEPVFGGLTSKADEQATIFANRLHKLARHLRRWPRNGITCYRLYERDIPEIPLVVDRYGDHLHIVEFERPHDRDRGQHDAWLDLMAQTAAETLDIPPRHVFLKRRERQRGDQQHERLGHHGFEIEVTEGGLQFIVNLSDYTDTGLFLDHRQTRAKVRDECADKDVLNLFCYTGSFTVYAAAGGAQRTVSVDKSQHYLDWCQRNLALNGLGGPHHVTISADVMTYLTSLPERPTFDLAIVDPPTFSNSKGYVEDWIVQRDHVRLLEEVLLRVRSPGCVYFSTNFRTFRWELPDSPERTVREISKQTVPPDFRNERIHRCWKISK